MDLRLVDLRLIIKSLCALRLAEVKGQVLDALADDFDTPRAVHAVMDLVSHGNRQLQPVAEVGGGGFPLVEGPPGSANRSRPRAMMNLK